MESTADKQYAHDLIERLEPEETRVAVRFLEFMLLDPVARSLATAPVEAEPITAEEAAALDEARASLDRGEGIPHEEILREFGLRPR
jgi:hypothetical protein